MSMKWWVGRQTRKMWIQKNTNASWSETNQSHTIGRVTPHVAFAILLWKGPLRANRLGEVFWSNLVLKTGPSAILPSRTEEAHFALPESMSTSLVLHLRLNWLWFLPLVWKVLWSRLRCDHSATPPAWCNSKLGLLWLSAVSGCLH